MQIIFKSKKLVCDGKDFPFNRYVKIIDEVNKLKAKKRILARQYFDHYNLLLNDEKDSINQSKFDDIVNEMNKIEELIEELTGKIKRTGEEQDMIAEIYKELRNLQRSDNDALQKSKFDKSQGETIAKNFKKRVMLFEQLKNIHTSDNILYMRTNPKSIQKTPNPIPITLSPKEKPKNLLTKKEVSDIKKNIADLLKRTYMFKDKQECISKQRSKPFFTSKEDILKEIEKNKELKKLMPSNYKSYSKEKLCEYFFDG